MRVAHIVLLVVSSSLALASCKQEAPEVKLQKALVEKRFAQQRILDELYQEYGHGELAGAVKQEAAEKAAKPEAPDDKARDVAKELLRAVGNAAVELDRAAFERHCVTTGTGKRAAVLSEKGKAYFQKSDVIDECKKVAALEIEMDALEAELGRLGVEQEPAGKE